MAALNSVLHAKFSDLRNRIASYGKVIVAFSGGLDSGFLLHTAVTTLGEDNVLAVTGDSESLSSGDRDYAAKFAKAIGLGEHRHIMITTNELNDDSYASNPQDRCYFCKRELYGSLRALAADRGFEHVLDGCNASDIGDYRPGRRAAAEFSVESPLLEVGLSKDEIRELACSEGLEIWDKPQAACLSSRIPYGQPITAEKLSMIDQAEAYLREIGFRQLRVRHHGQVARIELERHDFVHLLDSGLRDRIIERFREIGFLWVTLDLKPFESGSMNIMIQEGDDD
jgi:uncharacterized protein